MAVGDKIIKNKYLRASLAASVILAVCAGLAWFFYWEWGQLFRSNPAFTLRKVELYSSGWWKGKNLEAARRLGLKIGETNIYAVDIGALRKKLTDDEANIESASVSRKLPDTLVIRVTERIPRAFLFTRSSVKLVDNSGIVMSRDSCVNFDKNLPLIKGFIPKKPVEIGTHLGEIKPALELIELQRTEFVDFRIGEISLARPGEMEILTRHKLVPDTYTVIMPRTNLKFLMKVLDSVFLRIAKSGEQRKTIDLNIDGSVILK
jgi:hypothetical protein